MSADAVWALEVVPHDQDVDPHARALRQILHDLGTHPIGVTHGRLYLVAGPQSARLHAAVRDLCVDPVIAQSKLVAFPSPDDGWLDRKSTRLSSSHLVTSYAVSCLKTT